MRLNKYPEDAYKLAKDIDQFYQDYDPYSYNDAFGISAGGLDPEENIQQMEADLQHGDIESLVDFFEEIIEDLNCDPEPDDPYIKETLNDATVLLNRIKKFGSFKESLEENTSDRKLFKEFKVYVDGRMYEISHTAKRKDEIINILKQTYPDSEIEAIPYNHYESGYERQRLERIIAAQLAESLNEANFWGYNYRYEVRSFTPSGRDYLLGGAKDLENAEKIVKNQIDAIKNSFDKAKDKIHRIKNIYVLDTEDGSKSINLGYELEAYKKQVISEIESKNESLEEDTIKTKDDKWTNKGKEGTHGKFKTKKEADAQRKAMFANGYHESLNEGRYSDAYDDEIKRQGWWYFTTHGVQPGSIPKDLHVLEVRDGKNEKGTMGTFIRLDGILNTSELREFDMKEMRPLNESLTEEFYDTDFISYNDYLADNFDGWSDDIDSLIRDLNRCAKALNTRANKLIFYIDYDEDFWAIEDIASTVKYIGSDYSLYQLDDLNELKFICENGSGIWIFKNTAEANKVLSLIDIHNKELDEEFITNPDKKINNLRLEGLVDISDDFKIARLNWDKLGFGISFDDALEEWNKESNMAEPIHFYAKPIYSIKAWDNMIQFFKDKEDEIPGESHIKHKEEDEEENVDLPDEEENTDLPDEETQDENIANEPQSDFNQEIMEN